MDHLADRLDEAADALSALAREVPSLVVAPGVTGGLAGGGKSGEAGSGGGRGGGGDGPGGSGWPGRIGRALHERWSAVVEARAHEASSAAARVAETARSVRATRRHYAETDEAVERRFTQEL